MSLVAGSNGLPAQAPPEFRISAFRSYGAETSQTFVTAFVELPYRMFESAPGPDAEIRYGLFVKVSDSTGLTLHEASWGGRVGREGRAKGASRVEVLDFALSVGRYRVTVTAQDSVAGRSFSTTEEVDAWSTPPDLSDLMLSPSVRLVAGSDETPGPGEIYRGRTFLIPVAFLRLTPLRSRVYYLLEAYPSEPDSGMMRTRVSDSSGTVVVVSKPVPIRLPAGGSVLMGQVDLAGLPGGTYSFAVEVVIGTDTAERSSRFEMAGMEETLQREQEEMAFRSSTDEGYFGAMNEEQLNQAEAPLALLTSADSLRVWNRGMSVDAKRRWLTRFWQGRDPTRGTPANEARQRFYAGVAEANRIFKEPGRSKVPGWKTDRGRVYLKYGTAAEQLDRRTPSGTSPPYQVWRYTGGKELFYIFIDRSGLGSYQLVASNDPREGRLPDFREQLSREALQDISRWLGVDLFASESGLLRAQ